MKKIIIILCLVVPHFSLASTINDTKITAVLAGEVYGSLVLLAVAPKPTGTPDCQTSSYYNYAFDPTTEVGKVTLSMALTAYASGKPVFLNGYGSCGLYQGIENLRQMRVQ